MLHYLHYVKLEKSTCMDSDGHVNICQGNLVSMYITLKNVLLVHFLFRMTKKHISSHENHTVLSPKNNFEKIDLKI